MNGDQESPHDGGDQQPVFPEIVPRRQQAQHHDGVDGYGVEKGKPAVALHGPERGHDDEYQQRNEPHQRGRQRQYHILVGPALERLFGHLRHGPLQRAGVSRQGVGVGQQFPHRYLEQLCQLHQRHHIRHGFSPLPFGDGLVGIIQFFRQSRLGQSRLLAVRGNIGADLISQSRVVHGSPPAYSYSYLITNGNPLQQGNRQMLPK